MSAVRVNKFLSCCVSNTSNRSVSHQYQHPVVNIWGHSTALHCTVLLGHKLNRNTNIELTLSLSLSLAVV